MSSRPRYAVLYWLITFVLAATLSACATDPRRQTGIDLIHSGRFEEGLAELEALSKEYPSAPRYRADWLAERESVVSLLLRYAQNEMAADNDVVAATVYRRVLTLAPNEPQALAGLARVEQSQRHRAELTAADADLVNGKRDAALERVLAVLNEDPNNERAQALRATLSPSKDEAEPPPLQLGPEYQKRVTLELRDAELKLALAALSQQTGIDFIFDRDVPPDGRVTILVTNTPVENVIDLVLKTQNLARRVVNDHTLLLYPNSPDKVLLYEEQIVKSFFLTHADGPKTLELLKTLLKIDNAVIDERLNVITVRAAPSVVAMAEKLIVTHDLAPAEVMLEVEVLEVKRSQLQQLGVQFPDQLTLTPLGSSSDGMTLTDLKNLNSDHIAADIGSVILTLRKQSGDATLLANPRIRARDREKAKVLIGDRVPVITTTSTSTGFVSESVQYVDVGLNLQVEPHVHRNNDVAITMSLEVSTIVKEVTSSSGSLAYQIGTRSASTVLRLKNGETQVLAGLISNEERNSAAKVPGFGELPVLGRLFSSNKDENQKTEIVLSITPRIIRVMGKPAATSSP